jgi:hypothetical protein
MTAFGQAGKAGKIKPKTCKQMIAFYRSKATKKTARKAVRPKGRRKAAAKKRRR